MNAKLLKDVALTGEGENENTVASLTIPAGSVVDLLDMTTIEGEDTYVCQHGDLEVWFYVPVSELVF